MKTIFVDGEKYFINLSFDIDDFIGDGIWCLQLYDCKRRLIYDKPFASSQTKLDYKRIKTFVRDLLAVGV